MLENCDISIHMRKKVVTLDPLRQCLSSINGFLSIATSVLAVVRLAFQSSSNSVNNLLPYNTGLFDNINVLSNEI